MTSPRELWQQFVSLPSLLCCTTIAKDLKEFPPKFIPPPCMNHRTLLKNIKPHMSLICMADSFHMQTTTRRLYLHCAYKHMVSKPLASATNGLPHSQNVANEAQVQIPLPKHLLAASPPQKPGGTWKMQLCNAWDKWLDSDSELPSDHRGPWSENRRMMWSFHVICIDLLSSKECRSWRISSKCSTSISPTDVFWYWAQSENIKVRHGCMLSVSWMYYPESRASCQALYCTKM